MIFFAALRLVFNPFPPTTIDKKKAVVVQIQNSEICQEEQLQQAAKNNEEAQAVINQLKASLTQLEVRLKQVRVCYM